MLQFLTKSRNLIFYALLLGVTACRLFHAETRIQVQVVNAAGEPIPEAQVAIQKQVYGRTNTEGLLTIQTDLPVNEKLIVEVTKNNPNLFYAPYYENIHVKRGENNSFKLRATLFAVPKTPTDSSGPPLAQDEHQHPEDTSEIKTAVDALNNETIFSLPPTPLTSESPSEASLETPVTSSLAREFNPPSEDNSRLLTFYVESNTQPVANAGLLYGDNNRLQWMDACTSNARGRCTFTLPADYSSESVTVMVRVPGYITQTQSLPLAQGDRFRFNLRRGNSLDIFALQRHYQSVGGLKGIRVKLGEKELGTTDDFGFFSAEIPTSTNPNQSLQLLSSTHVPAESLHEVMGNSALTIVQNYQKSLAPHPRVFMLPIHQSGTQIGPKQLAAEEKITRGIRQHILNQTPFEEADLERIGPLLSKLDISPKSLAKKGWQQSDLVHEMEYVLRTYLLEEPQPTIELSLIDSKGRVTSATKAFLTEKLDEKVLRTTLRRLTIDLAQQIPFEGSLIESEKDGFRINLGLQKGHALASGESFTIHGSLSDAAGQKRNWTELGSGTIIEVGEQGSKVKIDELKAKAVASVGQTIRIKRGPSKPDKTTVFEVKDKLDKHGLIQANIYFNEKWIGATDQRGTATINSEYLSKRGSLSIFKPGYRAHREDFVPDSRPKVLIPLQRDSLSLRIESIPDQAQVKLNGRLLGRTPLYQTSEPMDADVILEVNLEDYRTFQTTVTFDEDGLDFTGERAITLERDLRREARKMLDQGRVQDAIELLEGVPGSHPNFLLLSHELGEIYLNRLQDPIKAISSFQRVTSRPEIADFTDKRFIGTHINEAVALYHAAEKLHTTDPTTALEYWKQATDKLNKTESQIRYVPQDQYTQALHSVYYYRAISLQRSWALTQKQEYLKAANEAWKSYIQSTALSTPADRNYALLKKAETFFKQTQALLQDSEMSATKAVDPNQKTL